LVSTEPWASRTATGAKFSEAIISSVDCWRCSSAATAADMSGSSAASGRDRVICSPSREPADTRLIYQAVR